MKTKEDFKIFWYFRFWYRIHLVSIL